jgi:hypothetical protein
MTSRPSLKYWKFFSLILLGILMSNAPAYSQNRSQDTRTITFLGEKYGVFYRWTTENPTGAQYESLDLFDENFKVDNYTYENFGAVGSKDNLYYNTVEGATANASSTLATDEKLYLTECFVHVDELDPPQPEMGRSGMVSQQNNLFIAKKLAGEKLKAAKQLRKTHQFTGAALSAAEVKTLTTKEPVISTESIPDESIAAPIKQKMKTYISKRGLVLIKARGQTFAGVKSSLDAFIRRMSNMKYDHAYSLKYTLEGQPPPKPRSEKSALKKISLIVEQSGSHQLTDNHLDDISKAMKIIVDTKKVTIEEIVSMAELSQTNNIDPENAKKLAMNVLHMIRIFAGMTNVGEAQILEVAHHLQGYIYPSTTEGNPVDGGTQWVNKKITITAHAIANEAGQVLQSVVTSVGKFAEQVVKISRTPIQDDLAFRDKIDSKENEKNHDLKKRTEDLGKEVRE